MTQNFSGLVKAFESICSGMPLGKSRHALTICLVLMPVIAIAQPLPLTEPDSVGMSAERLAKVEPLVLQAIEDSKLPGAVVCVGRHGKIAYLESFGNRQVGDAPQPMTTDTVFDMASITKPVATATSIMKLVEDGELRLGDKVSHYFPEFAPHGKDEITIEHLLLHQSGLIPDNPLSDYLDGPEKSWDRICQLKLIAKVGQTFKYSDVNFIVLAKLIEKISGQDVAEFSHDKLFAPLGMTETGYNPADELKQRAAPTEKRDGQWIRGEVHDPRAYELAGIAGHAGLFSTAQDMAIYAQAMLNQGELDRDGQQVRVLAPQTIRTMTTSYPVSSGLRGLGWDIQSPYSSNRGDLLSASAYGHGGFTGTVLWIDPELDLFFVFLSNRVHPNGRGSVNHLAGKILNVVASSIIAEPQAAVHQVRPGIDVLEAQNFSLLADQKVGLITNHTGLSIDGRSTAEILSAAPEVSLTALFSPEHGFEGKLDVAKIGDSKDAKTGLKVFSLYGATRRPTPEMLAEVDTLVFDIQDVGVRFYTYISTMGEAMHAAADAGKRFVVLDRPNPINGIAVSGPMLDAGQESFVGYHRLPVRHGMTTGEIANMIKTENELNLDLEIVRCEGWSRAATWDQTNLTWINPSPNLRSLTQAFLYPGIGLLETTNVSVGRGTDTPFEVLGAPWIDGRKLATHLNSRSIPGVRFIPIQFTPDSSVHANQSCGGINIMLTDLAQLEPVQVGLEIAVSLRQLYPDDWNTKNLNRLLGNQQVHDSILHDNDPQSTLTKARQGVSEFRDSRQAFLLYQ